jgi:hypothetical protein
LVGFGTEDLTEGLQGGNNFVAKLFYDTMNEYGIGDYFDEVWSNMKQAAPLSLFGGFTSAFSKTPKERQEAREKKFAEAGEVFKKLQDKVIGEQVEEKAEPVTLTDDQLTDVKDAEISEPTGETLEATQTLGVENRITPEQENSITLAGRRMNMSDVAVNEIVKNLTGKQNIQQLSKREARFVENRMYQVWGGSLGLLAGDKQQQLLRTEEMKWERDRRVNGDTEENNRALDTIQTLRRQLLDGQELDTDMLNSLDRAPEPSLEKRPAQGEPVIVGESLEAKGVTVTRREVKNKKGKRVSFQH